MRCGRSAVSFTIAAVLTHACFTCPDALDVLVPCLSAVALLRHDGSAPRVDEHETELAQTPTDQRRTVTKKQKQSDTTTPAKGIQADQASESASDTSPNVEETEELDLEASESDGLESEEEDEGDPSDDDTTDRDVLIALGELDAEAAEAYRIVADGIDDPTIRAKLEEFAQDHQRHVDSINALLSAGDGEDGEGVISTDLDEGSSSITMLAAAMDGMGDRAALLTMIGNEQLTNSAYPTALELPFEEDVLQVLQRNAADEERHLAWLLGQEKLMRESGAEVGLEG